jgi:hypothetical protein
VELDDGAGESVGEVDQDAVEADLIEAFKDTANGVGHGSGKQSDKKKRRKKKK